ncbi:hypothetical protein ABZ832_28530 [Streptantibioticus parmotrematis]|uniref:hypothetical protein n=1 Tax=Streptantibioticus parmotrematis TaxID=2873249 RepID=UPI0033F8945F
MADDDRDADVLTLPRFNLSPSGAVADDDDVPGLPEPPSTAPPPDFSLPFHVPEDEEDGSAHDPDNAAGEMVNDAVSGTGTPARATSSMAMVTMAAIAVAAMRGTWSMASYLKARREHHDAVADKAREASDKQKVANAGKGARNRVQSGPEFGRSAARGGGRGTGGGSGSGSRGGGHGAFGQKGGTRGSTGNSSTRGGRGAVPKGSGSGNGSVGGRRGPNRPGSSGSNSTGTGSRRSKGSAGSSGGSRPASGSGRGAGGGSSKRPGTLGQMALNRQKRKNDEAKASRQAAADQRKADLADRAAARKRAEKDADAHRKRKAEKRKAKLDREKAGGSGKAPKDGKTRAGKENSEKVDLTKKPKADDTGGKKNDDGDTSTAPKRPADGTAKRPRKPRWKKPSWKRRRRRWKPGRGFPGGKRRRTSRTSRSGPSEGVGGMPGGDGEWLKPPPGWDVAYSVTIEREPMRDKPYKRCPAGVGTGHKGLPAGQGEVSPTRTEPKESPIVMGTAAAVGEIGDTQFVDADLTVYDLIDSDEEMSEQILAGVDHMRLVASKCEGLKSGLENLYATCVAKKVPGVLVKWCIRLMERAGSVQDKAEALAVSLPRASEAILTARDTAIEADKHRADAVKDAGHVAPAEREYHDRSGV